MTTTGKQLFTTLEADGTLTLTFQLRKGRLTRDHTESITPDWEAGRFRHNHGGWSEE